METYKGKVTQLVNTRIFKPSVNAPKSQMLEQNWDVDISHAIRGEMYQGIDIWYVLTNRTFVWSGAVSTGLVVPVIPKKFLVTADDIGVVEEIDLAARLALKNGLINSIAVLVNKNGDKDDPNLNDLYEYLEGTYLKGTTTPLSQTTHIGLHYTISSGIPVSNPTKVNQIVDQDGYFPEYKGFDEKYKSDLCVSQAMNELNSQYQKFKSIFKREPAHFTSHHDVHTFTYPLFESIHQWAISKKIPIRSHSFLPRFGRMGYDLNVKLNLPSIDTMDVWSQRIGSISSSKHTLVCHYGPVPFMPILSFDGLVKKKHNKLDEAIYDFFVSRDETRELMVHIIKSEETKKGKLKKMHEALANEYPGVDTRYFAGRNAEYVSLQTRKSALVGKTNNFFVAFDFIRPDIRL